eukprot:scaffold6870_cov121-Cylindrotheca_fusiformis.AAC.18
MGDSSTGYEKPEQPRGDSPPLAEIDTNGAVGSDNTKPNHILVLQILSYGLPWIAWLLNIAALATFHFQEVDLKVCDEDDSCVERSLSLGLSRSRESHSSSKVWSMGEALNDLADEDYYTNAAFGSAIVPITLGALLFYLCCGPVLLGEFEKGQDALWTLASLVHLLNAVFSAVTLVELKTDLCQGDICEMVESNEKFSSENSDCQEHCTPGAGFYLSIVASIFWMTACVCTVLMKKASETKKSP